MKTKIILIVSASLLFFNCKKEIKTVEPIINPIVTVEDSTPTEMHNSQTALDWQGTYKGITPCADCEGIETEINLNKDLTFLIKTKYLGKGAGKYIEKNGTFSWDKSGLIITLNGINGKPNQYKVGENSLTQMDMNGEIITGKLAKMYIFKK